MKVLVLGASGIIGSHLRIAPHPGITASYHRGRAACDLTDQIATEALLDSVKPDVIVNLAGESRPDVVEKDPEQFRRINIDLPAWLDLRAYMREAHLIHVSTQAIFGGGAAPYSATSRHDPVNQYGFQKSTAETITASANTTIIRPTFVLGIRPDPTVGRPNPVELMLGGQKQQVNDRWFSPSFAPDVAALIWDVCRRKPSGEVIHAGVPVRVSRYDIARALGCQGIEAVSHEDFPGIAPRPMDTTYAEGSSYGMNFEQGIADCLQRWRVREVKAA